METTAASTTTAQLSPADQPRFSGMSHVSVPCRDLAESKLFYSQLMGGTLVHEIAGFVEYRIEDIIFGLSEQTSGWTGPDDEYPHYAFYIDGPNYELMKSWLDRHSVPNYPYRRGETALIYFRDPSGNLFELYCDKGYERLASLPLAPRRGGPAIDFRALNYRWNGKGAALDAGKNPPRPHFTAFAHASIFCNDLEQAKRFFTKIIGGELIHDVDGFAEVRVPDHIGLTVRRQRHRARRRISSLRFLHRAGGFSADGRVAPTKRREGFRTVDARRRQGAFVFPRSVRKSLRDVLSEAQGSGVLCPRREAGWQLYHRLRRFKLPVERIGFPMANRGDAEARKRNTSKN